MERKNFLRTISAVLVFVLLISLMPVGVLAADGDPVAVTFTVTETIADADTAVEGVEVAVGDITGTTDAEGKVTLEGLTAGTEYTVSAEKYGYAPAETKFTAEADDEVAISLTAYTLVTVTGTVMCEDSALANATVTLIYDGKEETTETDPSGAYSFANVYKELVGTVKASATGRVTSAPVAVDFDKGNTINLEWQTFQITSQTSGDGTVGLSAKEVKYGESVTATIVANDGSSIYRIADNGTYVQSSASGSTKCEYTINNVVAAHAITAVFVEDEKVYHFWVDADGKLWEKSDEKLDQKTVKDYPGLSVEVNEDNGEITLSYEAADNFRVTEVTVDNAEPKDYNENGQDYPGSGEDADTFTLDEGKLREYTIKVARDQFKIDTNDDENIKLSTDDGYVDYDRSVTLTFVNAEHNYLSELKINGNDCTSGVVYGDDAITYTITGVQEDKNITVAYEEIKSSTDYVVAVTEVDVVKTEGTDPDPITYYLSNLNENANVTFAVDGAKVSRNEHGPFEDGIVVKGSESFETIYVMKDHVISSVAYKASVVKDTIAPEITNEEKEAKTKKNFWGKEKIVGYILTGTVIDEGGSGIKKVVYATKGDLSEDDVRKLTTKADFSNNAYRHEIGAGNKNTYYFWAIDYADNVSSFGKGIEVDTDETAPVVSGFEISSFEAYENANYAGPGVTFTVVAVDELSKPVTATLKIGEDHSFDMTATPEKPNEEDRDTEFTYTLTEKDIVNGIIKGEVSILVADNSDNKNEDTYTYAKVNNLESFELIVEKNAPSIKVTNVTSAHYYDADIETDAGNWHGAGEQDADGNVADVTFTVDIEDTGAGLILDGDKIENLTIKNGITEISHSVNADSVVYETYSVEKTVQVDNGDGTFTETTETVEEKTGKITKATVTFTVTGEEAKATDYNITINGVDAVGNARAAKDASLKFSIDKTLPTVDKIDIYGTIAGEESGEKKPEEASVKVTDYGYHFQEDTNVRVLASDIGSGVKYIHFFTESYEDPETPVRSAITTVAADLGNNNQYYADFVVRANFKGQIYAYATDNVDNIGNTFQADQRTTVETQDQHDGTTHITFEMPEKIGTDEEGTSIYTTLQSETKEDGTTEETLGSLPIKVTVSDTFNGISKISYTVKYPTDEEAQVYDVDLTKKDSDWSVEKEDENLNTVIEGTIELTEESNDIHVGISMWDNAGNKSVAEVVLSIDNTAPSFEVVHIEPGKVVYEDQPTDGTVQTSTGSTPYFIGFQATEKTTKGLADSYPMYEAGTLQVKIYERNFDKEKNLVKIAKKYLEGDKLENIVENDISNTIEVFGPYYDAVNAATGKTERKVAEYPYVENVYYIVELRDCTEEAKGGTYVANFTATDMAGYSEEAVEFFVIDEIAPAVSITFDNNDVRNRMYYNAERTATITVVERNFDNETGAIDGTASDDGKNFAFPTLGAWTDSANKTTHTATVSFTADGLYENFEATYADLAGHTSTAEADDFVVDTTVPEIVITGVEDKSANNGVVAPVITYTDTNINLESLEIDLTGANSGVAKYTATVTDIHNGQTYAYADFTYEKTTDDIYTLFVHIVDLAGNETTETITFSCNRFGSVFDLSEIKDMLNKYNQKERTLVITETNVDAVDIKNMRITLTKNGKPVDLILGTDFTVKALGGNGSWSQYIYSIKDTLFADDGTYSLYFYTEDAAGNINENIDEAKDAQVSFGIDKTTPIINPVDFESNTQYAEEGKTVSIEIKDNLILENVHIFLNDEEIEYVVDGETYTFFIPQSNAKQTVRIVSIDAAGNQQEIVIEDFLVTTNIFARWYNNTPLFIGSMVVLALLLGIGAWRLFLIFFKKKDEEEEEV